MLISSAVSVIHDILSFAGWTEDRGSALYDAIKKGDEYKVAETLNWELCPRYSEIPQSDEILKRAVLFYPHIAGRLLDHYKDEISDDVIIEIFHDAVEQKCTQGIIVLLQHRTPTILLKSKEFIDFEEVQVLADTLCYAAAEGQTEVVTLLLSFEKNIPLKEKHIAYRNARREGHDKTEEVLLQHQPGLINMLKPTKRVSFQSELPSYTMRVHP